MAVLTPYLSLVTVKTQAFPPANPNQQHLAQSLHLDQDGDEDRCDDEGRAHLSHSHSNCCGVFGGAIPVEVVQVAQKLSTRYAQVNVRNTGRLFTRGLYRPPPHLPA